VRPAEDIGDKVAGLYGKISHPVLTDLKLTVGEAIRIHEVYPPKLPDLFHGNQLVVIGRYTGFGHQMVKLTGMVGSEKKEFVYELTFPERTASDTGKDFVEALWARRKVGYLLDQIRVNGEKKELIEEVVALAKRYGIATPYTSHLVVPDAVMPVAQAESRPGQPKRDANRPLPMVAAPLAGGGGYGFGGGMGGKFAVPAGLAPAGPGSRPMDLESFARQNAGDARGLFGNRGGWNEKQVKEVLDKLKDEKDPALRAKLTEDAKKVAETQRTWDVANLRLKGGKDGYQTGRLGVDLAECSNALRCQDRLSLTANRLANGRNCLELGGVWIDDAYKAETKSVTVKSQSDAYFLILEKHPEMKEVFRLGNYVVWITPSGTALVVDQNNGKEKMEEAEIAALFAKK
jgi:Ca-activated chloride channel family protein